MRYEINNKLKQLIWQNRNKLASKEFYHQYKNWLYINKSHLEDLCRFLGINLKHINLKEFKFPYEKNFGNVSMRYRSSPKKIKFNGVDRRFAEFIGILLGDGNLDKSQNQINIITDSREEQYIKFVNNLFYQIFEDNLKQYKVNKKTQ